MGVDGKQQFLAFCSPSSLDIFTILNFFPQISFSSCSLLVHFLLSNGCSMEWSVVYKPLNPPPLLKPQQLKFSKFSTHFCNIVSIHIDQKGLYSMSYVLSTLLFHWLLGQWGA